MAGYICLTCKKQVGKYDVAKSSVYPYDLENHVFATIATGNSIEGVEAK